LHETQQHAARRVPESPRRKRMDRKASHLSRSCGSDSRSCPALGTLHAVYHRH
jgi:hypothetical protein